MSHPKANLHNPSEPQGRCPGRHQPLEFLLHSPSVSQLDATALQGGSPASPRLNLARTDRMGGVRLEGLEKERGWKVLWFAPVCAHDRSWCVCWVPRACRAPQLPGYLWCEGCAKSQNRLFCLESIPMWQYQHKEMNNTVILYLEGWKGVVNKDRSGNSCREIKSNSLECQYLSYRTRWWNKDIFWLKISFIMTIPTEVNK